MFHLFGKKYKSLDEYGVAAISPSARPRKVTKSDSADLPEGPCRGLWVGTAGTANLRFDDGSTADNFPLFPGMNQIACQRVLTGGTADDIWALY